MPRPRKRFAQHWLRSEAALAKIVGAASLAPDDRVLEIGPGTGVLTRKLLPLVQSLIAVEIDRDLAQALTKQFAGVKHFHLIESDFLTIDLPAQLAHFPEFQQPDRQLPNKVVANIPYNITGPILEKLLGTIAQPNPQPFQVIVLLMQKEVAERICAAPGTKVFGALSVRVQYLAEAEWICNVPAKAFQPPPKVDSAVVRLVPRQFQPSTTNPHQLDMLVKLGFATKRKMLRNNIQCFVERDRLSHILEDMGINPQARAENLSVAQWVALSNQLELNSQN
ncbi:MAG: 16S rRNA (adenine(1518)-N(6)/adenine(1519)-N(6)) -dimethyltransferase RsmA [Elainellaceae cyanobacterium]